MIEQAKGSLNQKGDPFTVSAIEQLECPWNQRRGAVKIARRSFTMTAGKALLSHKGVATGKCDLFDWAFPPPI